MPSHFLSTVADALTDFDQVVQRVRLLRVLPGSRSVRFQLKLTLPSNPVFAVFDRTSGTEQDDFTQKPVDVGWSFVFVDTNFDSRLRGLRPERPYRYRIIIPASPRSSQIVLTGQFFTARREVSIKIDELLLFKGGSEDMFSGAPDVTFFTAVYDAGEPRQRLTNQRIFGEISAWNGFWKVPFGKDGDAITNPPPAITPYMHAFENDVKLFESVDVGRGTPEFLAGSGAFDHGSDDGDFAGDSRDVLLPDDEGEHEQRFTLDTGPRRIHFQANGTIRTTVFPAKDAGLLMRVGRARTLTTVMRASRQMKTRIGEVDLQFGVSDSQLFIARRSRREAAGATRLSMLTGEALGGALTAVAGDATAHVFVGSRESGVRSIAIAEKDDGDGRWEDLGGPAVHSLSARATHDAIDLIGLDADGWVHHARVDASHRGQPKWRELGGPVADAMVSADRRSGPVVFTLSKEGRVSAMPLDETGGLRDVASPRLVLLTAREDESGPVLVGVDAAGRVHGHSAESGGDWIDMGPLDLFGPQESARDVEPVPRAG